MNHFDKTSLQTFINSLPGQVWQLDRNGLYLAANMQHAEYFNKNPENLTGYNIEDIITKDEDQKITVFSKNALATGNNARETAL